MKTGTSERGETPASGKPLIDALDFCVGCGLPSGGMTVDGLCHGCYEGSLPNVPRSDPRPLREAGPFR